MDGGTDTTTFTHRLSVAQHLFQIVAVVAVPLLLLTGGMGWQLARHEIDSSRQAIVYASRSVSSAVDAQLGKYLAAVQALAASPSLERRDLEAFRPEAERAMQALPGAWLLVADTQGQQKLNTLKSASEPLPLVIPPVMADEVRAFETKRFQVSGVGFGTVAQRAAVGVGVPIFIDEAPAYFLMIVVDVLAFRDLLHSQGLPEGWLAGVIDRQGNFIARSRDHENLVGKPASDGWRAVRQQDVVFENASLEGTWLVTANTISKLTGWATAVAIEKGALEAPIRSTTLTASVVGLIVTAASLLFAGLIARRIVRPIRALQATAATLRERKPVVVAKTGVVEIDHALEAFDEASKTLLAQDRALRESADQLRLLLDGAIDYAVFMLDPDGRIMTWNDGARRLKGYEAADVINRHFSMFYASKDLAANELQLALRAGVVEKECEHVRKDGTRFIANVTTTPLYDSTGTLKGFSRIARDVSDRKREEQRLRSQAALLDVLHDAIIFRDAGDEITFWSRGAERLYGWPSEKVIGQVSHGLLKTRFPKPLDQIRADLTKNGQWNGELSHTRSDGREIVVISRWVLQRDKAGQPVGVLEVNRMRE